MTQKQLRTEIEKNIQFWTHKETLKGKEQQYKANIVIKGVKEAEVFILIYPENNNTFVKFKTKQGIERDIKSYEGTYSNLEHGKDFAIDYAVKHLADKYK